MFWFLEKKKEGIVTDFTSRPKSVIRRRMRSYRKHVKAEIGNCDGRIILPDAK